jgi:hypothetical protein
MVTPTQLRAELAAAEHARRDAKIAALEKHIDDQLRAKFKGFGDVVHVDLPIKTRVALLHQVVRKYVETGWMWTPTEGDGVYVQEIILRGPAPVTSEGL